MVRGSEVVFKIKDEPLTVERKRRPKQSRETFNSKRRSYMKMLRDRKRGQKIRMMLNWLISSGATEKAARDIIEVLLKKRTINGLLNDYKRI